MKKFLFVLTVLSLLSCANDDDGGLIEGGDILAEYIVDTGNSQRESRHTFADNGTKFDKVFGPNGRLDKTYAYDAQGRLVSVVQNTTDGGGNVNGSETFTFEYDGNFDILVRQERTGNAGNFTLERGFNYEGNNLVGYYGSYPFGLFREKYEFDSQGRILKIETYEGTGDFPEYFKKEFMYEGNVLKETKSETGNMNLTNGVFHLNYYEDEFFEYFPNANPNPFKEVIEGVQLNILLAPEAFDEGLFLDGVYGTLYPNFMKQYQSIYDGSSRFLIEIRDGNITFQSNGLPKSGFRRVGGIPFEFTYSE